MKLYTIYRATNNINGKVYIGCDSAWPRRMKGHLTSAKSNRTSQYKQRFHDALRKYGAENFTWDVIYQSFDGDHTLNVMEEHFIREYHSCVALDSCNGYNLTMGGEGQKMRPMSVETRTKKSKALHNRPSPLSRMIHAPYGDSLGVRTTARAIGVPIRTLNARLDSDRFVDWYYLDTPKSKIVPKRNHKPARPVSTSHGIFDNVKTASEALGISTSTIEAKIRSVHSPDWYRL